MKTTVFKMGIAACLSLLLLLLGACKKGNDNFLHKHDYINVSVMGFNGGSQDLSVKIGGYEFPPLLLANKSFNESGAYTFNGNEDKVNLTVSEKTSGKVVFEKELKKADGSASISFLYMDGQIISMPEKPAVQTDKISLIYMFQPTLTNYKDAVDIVVGKYFSTPQVFEEITRAKNVKPNEFTAPITFPTFSVARQEYNGVLTNVSFSVRIFKAGTNIPYVEGTSYTWNALNSTAPRPAASVASSKLYIFTEAPSGNMMRFSTRLEL